jgi:hypothetical protein
VTRTGQAAIDYARSRIGPNAMPASGYCLQFVRQCFDVGSYYGSAIDAWNGAKVRHPGDRNPPPAVPLYFLTPSQYDHVTFNVSPTEVISTFNADVRAFNGISSIEANFDGTYLGWAEDINGVTIYTPGGDDDMTPEQAQQLQDLWDRRGSIDQTKDWSGQTTAAVGRLETVWGAQDGRNRVGNSDETHDWSLQTTEAVGRVETNQNEFLTEVTATRRLPLLIVAALVLIVAGGAIAWAAFHADPVQDEVGLVGIVEAVVGLVVLAWAAPGTGTRRPHD